MSQDLLDTNHFAGEMTQEELEYFYNDDFDDKNVDETDIIKPSSTRSNIVVNLEIDEKGDF